ncbi:hypothetical protein OG787_12355 [Streptomyces sp. NBC_00075]|uniref:hypothetical protein n=1 Tax=Streptomyces sp. NBC_00075 TaxID=2975641 RepID=UPI003245DF20
MGPGVWVGDVVRALEVAEDDAERRQVLRLLGFTGTTAAPAPAVTSPQPRPVTPPRPRSQRTPSPATDSPPPPADTPEGHSEPPPLDQRLPLLEPTRVDPTGVSPARAEPLAAPSAERALLPHQPLLEPDWTAAILRAALSRQVAEGPVDTRALIDTLAHGRPVQWLPRVLVPTLRYGVQVLVDRGTGLQPFRRDQDELVARIRSVVGPDLVDVGYFSDAPQWGTGTGVRWTRTAYEPPARGTRVLLLSDLGLGGPPHEPPRSTRADWEGFVGLVTRAGCVAVALSPYPPDRWQAWMPALLPLVSWDRTTTTGGVQFQVRAR